MPIAIRITPDKVSHQFEVGDRIRVLRKFGDDMSVEYVAIVVKVHPDGNCDLSDPVDFLSAVIPSPAGPSASE